MKNSIEEALLPVLIVSSIVGLRTIEYPAGRQRICLSVICILLRWIIYFSVLGYAGTLLHRTGIESQTGAVIFYCNTINMFISMFVCLVHGKKFRRCLDRLAAVDDTLEVIGVPKEYSKLYKRTLRITWAWAVASCFLNVVDSQWEVTKYGILKGVLLRSAVDYVRHANSIVALNFGIIVRYVGSRFDRVNECMQRLMFDETANGGWVQEISILSRRKRINDKESQRIIWVAMHLHWELCSISRELNTVFELQMSLEMGSYFVFHIGLVLYAYYIATCSDPLFTNMVNACSVLSWLTLYAGKLFYINQTCENVSSKANVTGDISSKLINSMRDAGMRKDILQIVLQKKCRSLKFSAMGLFDFGDYFICMFYTSLVTVLVIMMQMNAFGEL